MDSYGQLRPSLFKDIFIYCSVIFTATFNVTFKATILLLGWVKCEKKLNFDSF